LNNGDEEMTTLVFSFDRREAKTMMIRFHSAASATPALIAGRRHIAWERFNEWETYAGKNILSIISFVESKYSLL